MKVIYIVSMAHSGSTLADCILGTHPDFIASGELRYLNWQLYRTLDKQPSVSDQNICSCEMDFRDCLFWSDLFKKIRDKTGNDMVADPTSFDLAYFKQFSYQNRGEISPGFMDKVKCYFSRKWCENGWSYKKLPGISKDLNRWLQNNWLLYESMSEVAERSVVVDSSKHLMIALLLQQYRSEHVVLLFLHRSIEGLVASAKRWAAKKNVNEDLNKVIRSKKTFEHRVAKYKRNIKNLHYVDVDYEEMVRKPSDFLECVVEKAGAKQDYPKQPNDQFFIDPSSMHLVAGNPMRYRGLQKVKYEERWNKELTDSDYQAINKMMNQL